MNTKENEITIVGRIPESTIRGEIEMKVVRRIMFDYLQVGPMFRTLLEHLEKKGYVKSEDDAVHIQDLFSVLNSSEFIREVPRVS